MNMLLETPKWVTDLTNAITSVLNPILILVAVAGIIYAIVVGVKFVKADEKGQRDEAKQKLIFVIVGIVVTFLLIALFYWIKANIGNWLDSLKTGDLGGTTGGTTGGATGEAGSEVEKVVINFIRCKLGL